MSGTGNPLTLYVGIDFGTTYSGVSISLSSWGSIETALFPNSGHDMRTKAPTRMRNDPYGKPIWGYDVPVNDDAQTLKLFKLGLCRPDELDNDVSNASNFKAAKEGWELIPGAAVGVTAAYLSQLVHYAIESLQIKSNLTEPLFSLPSHIVMTMPAVSPTSAEAAMKEVVKRAGNFGLTNLDTNTPVQFLAEQEASLLSILSRDQTGIDPGIEQGMLVTICDCGGGTVDVATYRCVSINPPILERCGIPKTGFCGAFRLDEAFDVLLRLKLEKLLHPHQLKQFLLLQRAWLHVYWEFELKRNFSHSFMPMSIEIPAEYLGPVAIRNEFVTFSWQDIESVFEPVVDKIIQLIKEQVETVGAPPGSPRVLVLTGGLGTNAYLHARVDGQFSGEYKVAPACIEKEEVHSRLAAVSRGAVFHGVTKVTGQHGLLRVVDVPTADASYAIRYADSDGSPKYLWLVHKGERLLPEVIHCRVNSGHFTAFSNMSRLTIIGTTRKNPRLPSPCDKEVCYISAPTDLLDEDQLRVGFTSEGSRLRFGLFRVDVELPCAVTELPC